jgi:hypothetical protein
MVVGRKVAAAVGAGYVASEILVRANLANLKPHEVYLGLNAVSVAALALLHSRGLFATALRVSFALRVASFVAFALMNRPDLNAFDAMTRWDSIAAAVGVVLVVAALFHAFLPGSRMRWAYELAFLVVAIPLVAILPKLFDLPRVHHPTLVRAAQLAERASAVPRGDVYDEKTDTSVVFTDEGETLFVGFNATRSPANVATDKDVRSKNIGEWVSSSGAEPRVHAGFGAAFDTVREEVMKRVVEWARRPSPPSPGSEFSRAPAGRRVVFVGHSLGGAHATIAGLVAAQTLSSSGLGPAAVRVDVYTFGAPAVGDGTFTNLFNESAGVSVRVADPLDPVARVSGVQFAHVRGYYPVSVPKIALKGIPNHGIGRYIEGITGSKANVALGMLLPLGLALAALTPLIGADVFLAHRRLSRSVAAVVSG